MNDLAHLSDLAVTAGADAARAILAVKKGGFTAESKADLSPVTAADLAADAAIRAVLSRSGHFILSEETYQAGQVTAPGSIWIVDPLDGTKEFVAGRDDYVIQIAFVRDGIPVLGVLHQPATGRVWRGIVGEGVVGRRTHISGEHTPWQTVPPLLEGPHHPKDTPPRFAVSISHPSSLIDRLVLATGAKTLPRGSVGLKIAAILDDEADAYVSRSSAIKVWDTAAPHAVVVAAGGTMSALDGSPLRYDGAVAHPGGILAGRPGIADVLAPAIATVLSST